MSRSRYTPAEIASCSTLGVDRLVILLKDGTLWQGRAVGSDVWRWDRIATPPADRSDRANVFNLSLEPLTRPGNSPAPASAPDGPMFAKCPICNRCAPPEMREAACWTKGCSGILVAGSK